MDQQQLLFVDDERFFAMKYIRELESAYRVTYERTALGGIATLQTRNDFCAFILDIQMPTPPEIADYETRNGTETGLWLLRKYRSEFIALGIPILILTNRDEERVKNCVLTLRYPPEQVSFYQKDSTPFDEFPQDVATAILRAANWRKRKTGAIRR